MLSEGEARLRKVNYKICYFIDCLNIGVII